VKKLAQLLVLLPLAFATYAAADEITFSTILGAPGSLTANAAGLHMGPARNEIVSDATTMAEFPLLGTYRASTGTSNSFNNFGTFISATYSNGAADSVLIVDSMGHTLVSGVMNNNSAFVSQFPDGAGSFLGTFSVTFVDPAVLALFGLGPAFDPQGSVSATFAHDDFNGTTMTGQLGGASVTITTPVTIPEPASLGLLGVGLLAAAGVLKRRQV